MKFSKTAPIKIIIIGAGGTGGYIIPHLYRIGFASNRPVRIIVCDGDVVEEKNLTRQNFILQDIGENKAKVLSERYSAAFGIETEYIPNFIESVEELQKLVEPDFIRRNCYNEIIEKQRVILIGAVDNNRSRQLCNQVFYLTENLVYIDSGNGESSGQVVCGIRQKGRTLYKPTAGIYPDILNQEDKFPSELSCAERNVSAPQSITANLTASTLVLSFLYDLIIGGDLTTRHVTFSSKIISVRPCIAKKRTKVKKSNNNSKSKSIAA